MIKPLIKKAHSPTGAVVIGGDFQGLGVIRSLSEKNVPVFLVEYEWSIGRYSRFPIGRIKDGFLLKDNRLVECLIDLAKKRNLEGWVVYPNSDTCVKLLSIFRDELAGWYRVPVPGYDVVSKILDKRMSYDAAEQIGVPIPKRYVCAGLDDLLSQKIDFPIVLKPSCRDYYFSKTKRKAVRVDNKDDLEIEYVRMSSIVGASEIIVQEMILGGSKSLYSFGTFFDGNNSIAGLSARRRRQHPMDFGHATTYAESVHLPEVEEYAVRLLKHIGYSGLAEVEFMKDDKDGVFKFIEINGRPWGWQTLAKAAGLNLPYVQYLYLTGQKAETITPLIGAKWIRLVTDTPTVCMGLLSGRVAIRDYWDSWKGKREFAVWSLKDPLPFFMEFLMIPFLFVKRGF